MSQPESSTSSPAAVPDLAMEPGHPGSRALPAAVLALDLGGTRLRTALVLADGRLIGRRSAPTPHAAAGAVVDACIEGLRATLAAAKALPDMPAPVALGISAPGPLDPVSGSLLDPPNLDHSLWSFPLAPTIGAQIGLPALLGLDVHVAALAEGDFGAAIGLTDYVYMTISTGVGGAVVTGGRLMHGPDWLAGELGHLMIDINGPPCGCGARGHLEALSSGTGIANAAREALRTGEVTGDGPLAALARERGVAELEARDVALAEERGDPDAARIMERARRSFAEATVTIVDVFNPQRIIVGGGIAAAQGDRLLGPAREAIADHGYHRQAARVEVVPTALGDDVGLIGAVSLVALGGIAEVDKARQGPPEVA